MPDRRQIHFRYKHQYKCRYKYQFQFGFTLMELLVTMAILSMLMSILLPSLSYARATARRVICGSNIRQLVIGNIAYSGENNGFFVLAAEDILDRGGNRKRWHGVRVSPGGVSSDPDDNRFDPAAGPLASYLADGIVNECPDFVPTVETFEASAGGYGYNQQYIGGRYDDPTLSHSLREPPTAAKASNRSARMSDIKRPGETVMFTDAAIAQGRGAIAEYSFCEPPFAASSYGSGGGKHQAPTIHFRHNGYCNTGWADGHVGIEQMSFTSTYGVYGVSEAEANELGFGWFGADSNALFDRE